MFTTALHDDLPMTKQTFRIKHVGIYDGFLLLRFDGLNFNWPIRAQDLMR